jgi:hypothetical protein
MIIEGSWRVCDDGVLRPIFPAEVRASDGSWLEARFLADTGADRTVLSESVLRALNVPPVGGTGHVAGVGGQTATVAIDTAIRMRREDRTRVTFNGRFLAVTDPAALDMSVLGRDITNLFALITDRPGDVVCLLGGAHRYQILPS